MSLDAVTLELIRLALREDLAGLGDVTSAWTVPAAARAEGFVAARDEAVVSGLDVAAGVLAEVDADLRFERLVMDGSAVAPGDRLARVEGPARALLSAERTMLNLLVHLCGVATQARRFARAVEGTGTVMVDTRKTTAGLRLWEKKAVRDGGCGNHRFGLFDLVLIKDNHLVAGGGVAATVTRARAAAPFAMKVEVEVADEAGLREAVAAGADIVMFDNVRGPELARLVRVARELRSGIILEASGRVDLESVRGVAESGVDVISSSALTAGAPPVDLGLDFEVRL
ncbi:MAG: carboxylating nicotinate-nucleotide diphosphorylase [Thermoleophilia bacterium]